MSQEFHLEHPKKQPEHWKNTWKTEEIHGCRYAALRSGGASPLKGVPSLASQEPWRLGSNSSSSTLSTPKNDYCINIYITESNCLNIYIDL